MADIGIKISRKNTDVNSAGLTDLLLSSKYPFTKIDTQNTNSFITVSLTFINEPPETMGTSTITKVYSLTHSYNYKPQFWATVYHAINPTVWLQGTFWGDYDNVIPLRLVSAFDEADIFFRATESTIDVYVIKNNDSMSIPVVGITVDIGFYVFVDGI